MGDMAKSLYFLQFFLSLSLLCNYGKECMYIIHVAQYIDMYLPSLPSTPAESFLCVDEKNTAGSVF